MIPHLIPTIWVIGALHKQRYKFHKSKNNRLEQELLVTYLLLQLLKSVDGCQVFNPHEFSIATTVVAVVVDLIVVDVLVVDVVEIDALGVVSSVISCIPIEPDVPEHASSTTQSLPSAKNTVSQQLSLVLCKYCSFISGRFQVMG